MKLQKLFRAAVLAVIFTSAAAAAAADDDFEAKRAEMVNRKREIIYNTDGCDAVYYPRELPATKENFINRRFVYTRGTKIDSLFYCPLSSGFGYVTFRTKAGDQLLADPPHTPHLRNVTGELLKQGTDPLKIAEEYCRAEGLEFFASLRVNDTHDQGHTEEKPMFLMSPFKRKNPQFLMGSYDKRPQRCSWSAVDFTHREVRDRMAAIVAEICANYDIDGIEYDFMRHIQLLKSVAEGGVASQKELDMMTGFMKQLRGITEAAGRKRGRPILVSIRVPDSVDYCRAVGIDLERWMKEKLFDIMTGASYFQLNPWHVSAELAHKYGIKFYASLDESRIGRGKGVKVLPGRGNSRAFYYARSAAAVAEGCDGVSYFNMEGKTLTMLTKVPLDQVGTFDKVYFATERGSGGYRNTHFLTNGDRFDNMPKLDPGNPRTVSSGSPYRFSIVIGDDLAAPEAKKREPAVTAELLADLPGDAKVSLDVNGRSFTPAEIKDGVCRFELPAETIKKGSNDFALKIIGSGKLVIRDFCVRIKYAPAAPDALESAATGTITPIASIAAKDGKIELSGEIRNTYLAKYSQVADGAIKLVHDSGERGADYMCFTVTDPKLVKTPPPVVVAEWKVRIPADNGSEMPAFQFVLAPPRGGASGDYEIVFLFYRDKIEFGASKLPGVPDLSKWNTFRTALDTRDGSYAVWINGKLAATGITSLGGTREAGFCHIGDGSGRIAGHAELAEWTLGTVGK